MKLKNFVLIKSVFDGLKQKEQLIAVLRAPDINKACDAFGVWPTSSGRYGGRLEVEFQYGKISENSKMWKQRHDPDDKIVCTHRFSHFSKVTGRKFSIIFDAKTTAFVRSSNTSFIVEELPEW